jgi:hypothetical protein
VNVSTGVQAVTYRAGGGGAFAVAMARADWFRAQRGTLQSVPLRVAPASGGSWPVDWWQRNLCDPP